MNTEQLMRFVGEVWDKSIVPALCEYIRIPNKSPHFDKEWEKHGHMDAAAELMRQWCEANALPGMKTEIVRLPGRTPLLFIDVPATGEKNGKDCVLMYGHMDKQPEFTGWSEGLAPWTPVIRNGRLYGRGGADDGYAVFGSLLALKALAEQNIPRARCVILIEGSEESGSPDLPAYVDALADRIGDPSLVVCLDAECGNYDQFWCTTSLRGNLTGTLRVDVLREGVHSGMASGIAASSMRIARQVLDRVEDSATGRIKLDALFAKIPEDRVQQAQAAAKALGTEVYRKLPMVEGMQPMDKDPAELLLNSTWRPTLSTTGVDGIPSLPDAGNVLRPYTAFKLSFRIPPGVDPERAGAALKEAFEKDSPYGAKVRYEADPGAEGWNAPSTAPWLASSISSASKNFFGGKDAMYMGIGGTIPFMGMLNVKFPKTQFLVTGVLGPQSNAHGPNEFLDIETGKKVTACVAQVVADHYRRA
ncbi:succinyl-diaminopimelate desuccinylase [Steroidobacter agaridevorans]|uniref:Succinyl-diaminopimelate desuccinylase n=1 Tax=Steroidobacter agaridevorans TaxID=2695856 RepID=A0A829YJK3_9GAMM|nr:M20 family metallopeptidase [Steroidobacter agaridevorans]GFE83527.1 succinyl-diaminopimelate desuccinylase [Steroidobacter agaridevorans]